MSYGFIDLDAVMNHNLGISMSTSKLFEMRSGKTANMFFAAALPTPITALINKIELVSCENPSVEEKSRELLLNFRKLPGSQATI